MRASPSVLPIRRALMRAGVLVAAAWVPLDAHGQGGGRPLPVKAALSASGTGGCAAFPAPLVPPGNPTAVAEARRLVDDAQDAALQGDHAAARDAFAKAAALVPGDARIAYYLGRELELLAAPADAVREYCRYLALAPAAPDGDEVRGRVVRLTPATELARVDEARTAFGSGVALLRRGQFLAADSAFAAVSRQVPAAPEPYYNRALSRAARGDRADALQDFGKYLELSPQASDAALVRGTMARLPDRVYRPGPAFGSGILFPGLGQMSTGRPIVGVVVLGAVAGAVVAALSPKDEVVNDRYTDPFGNAYADSLTRTVRPLAIPGLAAAGAIWVGAALESLAHARRSRTRAAGIIARHGDDAVSLAVTPLPRRRVGIGLVLPAGGR